MPASPEKERQCPPHGYKRVTGEDDVFADIKPQVWKCWKCGKGKLSTKRPDPNTEPDMDFKD